MKKLSVLIAAAFLAVILASCASLSEKSVVASADATGIKASPADTTTASLITIWLGIFNTLFIDHPKGEPALVFYKESHATFNADAKTLTYVYIGNNVKGDVTVEPNKIVSLPGIAVVNGSSDTIKISADTSTDSGSSNAK